MLKIKQTYSQLKQELSNTLLKDRDVYLILNVFFVSKLINQEPILLLPHFESNVDSLLAVNYFKYFDTFYNQGMVYDLEQLAKVFESSLDQKTHGIFYTDELLVDYVNNNCFYATLIECLSVEHQKAFFSKNKSLPLLIKDNTSIKPLFFDFIQNFSTDDLSSLKERIINLKFFDPTCGDGSFLVNIFPRLFELYNFIDSLLSLEEKPESKIVTILERNIFGNDIDAATTDFLKLKFFARIYKQLDYLPECVLQISFNLANTNFLNYNIHNDFDCIVGNPPYFESKGLDSIGFKTEKINNIYAPILEKCSTLLNDKGVMSMVVPISLIATPRMKPLRDVLKHNFNELFISSFADRPGSLFAKVHQKINIMIGLKDKSESHNLYTSSYFYFSRSEIKDVFSNMKYIENSWQDDISKYGNKIEKNFILKNDSFKNDFLSYTVKESEYFIYLNMRVGFWIKCFSKDIGSKEYKKIYFKTEEDKYIFMALLNSSIFYLYWTLLSDGWHITLKNLAGFKFDFNALTKKEKTSLVNLAKELEMDLEAKKEKINSKQSEFEYKHKKSKALIDKIDSLLQNAYGFDDKTLEYIKQHNLRYRMSSDYLEHMEKTNGA